MGPVATASGDQTPPTTPADLHVTGTTITTATLVVSTTDTGARRFEIPVLLDVTPDACPDGFSANRTIALGDQDSGVPNDH